MKHVTRRAAACAAMLAVLLLAAGICQIYRANRIEARPAQSERIAQVEADPLTRFRTERQQLRERQRAELNDMIHDDQTDEQSLSQAREQLLKLMESERAELLLEGLLEARGFEEVLATVSDGSVNVLVRRESLTRQETAVILELVLRETGVTSGNVKIIPIN